VPRGEGARGPSAGSGGGRFTAARLGDGASASLPPPRLELRAGASPRSPLPADTRCRPRPPRAPRNAPAPQSVALRMICDREAEVEKFTPREFWTITADLAGPDGSEFTARLTHADGGKIPAAGIPDRSAAEALAARVSAGRWRVAAAAARPGRRAPPAPFTTSSLQQEAARRLGWGASRTMSAAQQLYEGKDAGEPEPSEQSLGWWQAWKGNTLEWSGHCFSHGRHVPSSPPLQPTLPLEAASPAPTRLCRSAARGLSTPFALPLPLWAPQARASSLTCGPTAWTFQRRPWKKSARPSPRSTGGLPAAQAQARQGPSRRRLSVLRPPLRLPHSWAVALLGLERFVTRAAAAPAPAARRAPARPAPAHNPARPCPAQPGVRAAPAPRLQSAKQERPRGPRGNPPHKPWTGTLRTAARRGPGLPAAV
jgi:hypothetical protein